MGVERMSRDNTTQPTRSSRTFTVATILLFAVTVYMSSLYDAASHGMGMARANLRSRIDHLGLENRDEGSGVRIPKERLEDLERQMKRLGDRVDRVQTGLQIYPFIAVLAFLCSVIAKLREPRFSGSFALAFGIFGLYIALT